MISNSSLDGLEEAKSGDDIYVCDSGKSLETVVCVISLHLDVCSSTHIEKMENDLTVNLVVIVGLIVPFTATAIMADDNEEDFGPMPMPDMSNKKRKVLTHESTYLNNLPLSDRYTKSFMHRDNVLTAATTKTNYIVTTSVEGTIKFWHKEPKGIEFRKQFRAHLQPIVATAVSNDGSLVATLSEDNSVKVFDVVSFDMINMFSLDFPPSTCAWIHSPSQGGSVLAISDKNSSAMHLFDGRGDGKPFHTLTSIHNKPVNIIKYSDRYDTVISADIGGMIEYWSPHEPYETPKDVPRLWEFKSSTDLYEFRKAKAPPTSIALSPDSSHFVAFSIKDRKIRLFNFLSGKLTRKYDESLEAASEMQQAGTAIYKLDDMEFGRRLALESEIQENEHAVSNMNVIFDESGNFIIYPTLLGIKVVNIVTNKVARVLGKDDSIRFLNVSLYQGAPTKKGFMTAQMAASDNPILQESQARDPILFCSAYKRPRFHLFSNSEPEGSGDRDVFNEKPTQEEQAMTVAPVQKQIRQRPAAGKAILHTTLGDITLRLFADKAPKAVENFTGHASSGYYEGVIFHRIIRRFMLQTGDPLGDGTGGDSIFGHDFEDEFHPDLSHDKPYTLSMANAGPGTNASQFFITTVPTPWLDNKHTVFGRAISGMDVIHKIEELRVDRKDRPEDPPQISNKPAKAHQQAHAGRKAEKKAKKVEGSNGKEKPINHKAFISSNINTQNRNIMRNAEKNQKRLHVPLVDRTPGVDQAPPVLVAVAGPPGVGKTTLMKSLIRRYSKHTINDIKGPVTVVAGKARRITFVECPNDISSMIDIGKVADLVLMLIDCTSGFEMESMEMFSIMRQHGFPKIMGILSHVDLIKKQAHLRAQKKRLKHRFWTETYAGARLFQLSGVINGRYPNNEVLNLTRFISVMKFRPLIWRNTHPYLIADRLEDLTEREVVRQNPAIDRNVTLYGYVRGVPLKQQTTIHIPGAGDMNIKSLEALDDPCPPPTKDSERKRRLADKQRLIHAPMSDLGGVRYDKDAIWVRVNGNFDKNSSEAKGEGEKMVMDLQDAPSTLEESIKKSQIRLLGGSSKAIQHDKEDSDDEHGEELDSNAEDEDEDLSDIEDEEGVDNVDDKGRTNMRRGRFYEGGGEDNIQEDIAFDDSDSEVDLEEEQGHFEQDDEDNPDLEDDENEDADGEEDVPRWKQKMGEHASLVAKQSKNKGDLMSLIYNSDLTPEQIVYGDDAVEEEEDENNEEDFFQVKRTPKKSQYEGQVDIIRAPISQDIVEKWTDEDTLDSIRGLFITGADQNEGGDDENNEGFEDLENGDGDEEEERNEEKEVEDDSPETREEKRLKAIAEKKEKLKKKFDEQYDDDEDGEKMDFYDERKQEMAKKLEDNAAEFADDDPEIRQQVEGFRSGTYVRLELDRVPCEMVNNFNPSVPVIVGGLLPIEMQFGYAQSRLIKHRWHGKILKTNDPLIISLGWRRFQSIPIYSLEDRSIRNRMLKYTPEHAHCLASFYGPLATPNTAFCAFNTLSNDTPAFRISATGLILDNDKSTEIVKKLKLTGTAMKVHHNTAFIKDMFNSALEVAKFEGAHLRTVSGIRGQIKKAISKPEGAFRATFEDKLKMSDIIFLRAWYGIQPRKFYNPVTSLLDGDWQGMKLTGAIRKERHMKTPLDINSAYKPVVRHNKKFNPLKIPKHLQAKLPYASKPKLTKPQKNETYMQKRAVVMEPEQKRAVALIQQMRAIDKDKGAKRSAKKDEKRDERQKNLNKIEERRQDHRKEERKEAMKKLGIKRAISENSGGSKKRARK
ncbi:hypothetical protein E3P93_02169 [Wallemia ichthyophaga]|nr:hypothetical protein E3P93_02169 [Wallemia ichthyophaga]